MAGNHHNACINLPNLFFFPILPCSKRNLSALALNLWVDGDEGHEEAEGDEAQERAERHSVAQMQFRRQHPPLSAAGLTQNVMKWWYFSCGISNTFSESRVSCLFMIGQWECMEH